jgi:alkyl sulfatase BDS1-like metallo-beta-lactamase superfamily hydrolase
VNGSHVASPDTIKAMPAEMTFDYFAVRLNGEKDSGQKDRAQHHSE